MEEREIGGKKVTIAASIDAVGLYCPMPIILLKKEIGIVKSMIEVLKMI
jgi:TusA-related sulfurtransferase